MGSRPLEGLGQLWAQDAARLGDPELEEVSNAADVVVLGCNRRHELAFHRELCCLFFLGTSLCLSFFGCDLKPEEDLVIVIVIAST